jgi:hypothetical protein
MEVFAVSEFVPATSCIARVIVLQAPTAPIPQQDDVSVPLTLSTEMVPGLAIAGQQPLGMVAVSQKFVPVPAQSALLVHEVIQASPVELHARLFGQGIPPFGAQTPAMQKLAVSVLPVHVAAAPHGVVFGG